MKEKIKYLITYTCITIVIFLGSYYEFIKLHKTFLWNYDGTTLHSLNILLLGEYLREVLSSAFSPESINKFDFYNGFGISRLEFLITSYIEPINVLGVFSNLKNYDLIYTFLVAMRCWLIGLSFSYYCWYKNYDFWISLIGSIIYTFSGYFFYTGVRHPFFLCGLIFLPLLFIGVEKIIKERKRIFFIIVIFFSIISNYYFLYMNTIIVGLYLVIKLLINSNKKREIKDIFNIVISYFIGVLLSMVILLPEIYLILDSARDGFIVSTKNLLSYGEGWIIKNYIYMFTPKIGAGWWVHIGVSVYCYLTMILIFFKKGNRLYKIIFLLSLLILFFPVGGLIMTAFSYITNRWSYVFVFYSAISVMLVHKKLLKPTTKSCLSLGVGIAIYMLIGLVFCRNQYTISSIIWLLIFYIYFLILKIFGIRIKEKIKKIILLFLVSLNLISNGIMTNNKEFGNYVKQFATRKENRNITKKVESQKIEDNLEKFFRSENTDKISALLNRELLIKEKRTAQYFNIPSKNLFEYFKKLENSKQTNKFVFYGLDGRTTLLALNNIKYYRDNSGKLPYGYTNIEENLYRNNYFIPFGYTYSNFILENETLDFIDLQDTMLKKIVLSKNLKINYKKEEINKDYNKLCIKNIEFKNIEFKDNIYKIKSSKNKITLTFNKIKDREIYLRLKNINIEKELNKTWNIKIEGNGVKNDVNIFTKTSHFGTKQKNYTVNLGYINNEIDEVTITFPKKGEFTIDEFEIYAVSMKNYEKYIADLSKDALKNVKFGTNTIEGNIELEVPKILCLSIPYNRGWKAYVNDKEVEILRGNIMHMAIPLEAGQHRIKLVYTVPGLKLGAMLSVIGIIILVIVYRREKNKFAF